jgi:hypothetical protein
MAAPAHIVQQGYARFRQVDNHDGNVIGAGKYLHRFDGAMRAQQAIALLCKDSRWRVRRSLPVMHEQNAAIQNGSRVWRG